MNNMSEQQGLIESFHTDGYAILRDVVDRNAITALQEAAVEKYRDLVDAHGNYDSDGVCNTVSFAKQIGRDHDVEALINRVSRSPNLIDPLELILGPDISMNYEIALIVNDPADRSSVTNKPYHQEQWTGALSDDLTVWIPVTPVDEKNTLNVVPGSHFYGALPHRNRNLVPMDGFAIDGVRTISDINVGDALVFHSLLLHGTAGRSDNLRIALTRIYRPTFAPMSRRMQARGSICIKQGVLSRIRDALGNDAYSPLRTYGGKVSNLPKHMEDDFQV